MAKREMLTLHQLSKSFGSLKVIDRLSFSIAEGGRVALFAPSGAGKTTLIHILARLQSPDSGSFTLNEPQPVVLFQEPRLFPFLTVEENIFLPFRVQKKPVTDHLFKRYQRWLEVCELGAFCNHYPYQLSGGMKQKVALIRGLLDQPRFVMMDEPFQSISVEAKHTIIAYLLESNPDLSLLLVTHDLEEVPLLTHSLYFFSSPVLGKFIEFNTQAMDIQQVGLQFIQKTHNHPALN